MSVGVETPNELMVVFSNTMEPADGRVLIRGDLTSQLAQLKQEQGANIIMSCGPATLGPLASTPGLSTSA